MVLVGYWPLNESSGDTAYDHSGNENHGTINDGGDSTVPGTTGILRQNAYSFDGSNDYVNFPASYEVYNLSFWLNSEDVLDTNNRGIFLIGEGSSTGFGHGDWTGEVNGEVLTVAEGKSMTYTTTEESSGKWIFVSFNWNGSTYDVYVDGEKRSVSHNDGGSPLISYSGWNIGYRPSTPDRPFHGRLQEFRIYNQSLTASEIQYLYNVSKRGLQISSSKTS